LDNAVIDPMTAFFVSCVFLGRTLAVCASFLAPVPVFVNLTRNRTGSCNIC
jgi:hypothetical protein